MRLDRLDLLVASAVLMLISTPALAIHAGPAPVAGVGYGALALAAIGYRKLRSRIGR
jgi:hypothetical protein